MYFSLVVNSLLYAVLYPLFPLWEIIKHWSKEKWRKRKLIQLLFEADGCSTTTSPGATYTESLLYIMYYFIYLGWKLGWGLALGIGHVGDCLEHHMHISGQRERERATDLTDVRREVIIYLFLYFIFSWWKGLRLQVCSQHVSRYFHVLAWWH